MTFTFLFANKTELAAKMHASRPSVNEERVTPSLEYWPRRGKEDDGEEDKEEEEDDVGVGKDEGTLLSPSLLEEVMSSVKRG